ncbi:modulator of macroautophagy TMEM150B isoform X2 [Prionailurus viverrinus]|uniref:modulator of macroautophagy TMEM150B isoform X2 n=1 Tax=Prionailurus viverrinus TaxID=61388 RepID=UPI001FF62F8D|nr:modulator of macroautophagy TMEM150B isoform X2 [Prionailurus viverrinus]
MVWAEETIAFGEASSDEMSTPRSPFPPTLSLPTGEFQQLSRGRERGRQVRARRPGQQGPTSSSIRTETTPSTESDPWAWILRSQRSLPGWTLALPQHHPAPRPSPAPFSTSPTAPRPRTRERQREQVQDRAGSSLEKEKERERERFVALYLPCRARHVGLPVPAACFPGRLGYHWSLDCFCPCSGQQGCEPHRGFPLYQSCIFSQLLNMGAAMAAWICIIRYHQLRDLGAGKWFNLLILWTGLLCALGTSVVGNFQQKNQLPTHLTGAFFAFFVGNLYFWMQHLLFWWMKSLPQPGPPWIGPLRLGLCSLCTILMVTMVILHSWLLRSASAACEWAVAMLLFTLFGLFAVDFSGLDGCTLTLRPGPSLSSPPASPLSLQIPL